MKASAKLLAPGDVVQCAKPNDGDPYRRDELMGTVVYVQGKDWLRGADHEGTRADWYAEWRQAWAAPRARVHVAYRRARATGELTREALEVLAVVAYRTIVWAPKETPSEKAERLNAIDRWKDLARAAFVAGEPQPKRPKLLPKWKAKPFVASPQLRRWYFATIPPGAYVRAARGPEHTKADRVKARAHQARLAWLRKQRASWREGCELTPPLFGGKFRPKYRRPPTRRAWGLASVAQAQQLELEVAA